MLNKIINSCLKTVKEVEKFFLNKVNVKETSRASSKKILFIDLY